MITKCSNPACDNEALDRYCDECVAKDEKTMAELVELMASLAKKEQAYRERFGEIPTLAQKRKQANKEAAT